MHRIFINEKKICVMKILEALKNRLEHLNFGKLLSAEKVKNDKTIPLLTASSIDDEDLFLFI